MGNHCSCRKQMDQLELSLARDDADFGKDTIQVAERFQYHSETITATNIPLSQHDIVIRRCCEPLYLLRFSDVWEALEQMEVDNPLLKRFDNEKVTLGELLDSLCKQNQAWSNTKMQLRTQPLVLLLRAQLAVAPLEKQQQKANPGPRQKAKDVNSSSKASPRSEILLLPGDESPVRTSHGRAPFQQHQGKGVKGNPADDEFSLRLDRSITVPEQEVVEETPQSRAEA